MYGPPRAVFVAVVAAFALNTPLTALAEQSDIPTVEPSSTSTEKKSTRTDQPEIELGEVRVQAGADADSFRATDATTGALGDGRCWTRRSRSTSSPKR